MVWQQQISAYGLGNDVVARTFFQGIKIVDFLRCDENQRAAASMCLLKFQKTLLESSKIRDSVNESVSEGIKAGFRSPLPAPAVMDVQTKAHSFLRAIKPAIAQASALLTVFYPTIKPTHNFRELHKAVVKEFGETDCLSDSVLEWQDFTDLVTRMRNAVEHRHEGDKEFFIHDFVVDERYGYPRLVEPMWGIGTLLRPMAIDMCQFVENVLQIGEAIMRQLFLKLQISQAVKIVVVPPENRTDSNPCRLVVHGVPDPGMPEITQVFAFRKNAMPKR